MTEDLLGFPRNEPDLLDSQPRLFLLDGMALVYRAHFALIRSPRRNSAGLCTSAVFGMTNTVMDILKKERPTHIAVAFDTSEPTERHRMFPAYKAQRDAMPEEIALQLPIIDRLFSALKIESLRNPGYEADDIIGTLATEAAKQQVETWMVTPDKDYDQLVGEHVSIFRPGRKGSDFERIGVPEVLQKWGIERVDQVIDVLGLMGDASDNIPGVPGIGPKTAQKLIQQFGSIESLLDNADQLKGKQRERVEENRELALQSKQLVTIQLDVPQDVSIESLRWDGPDEAALQSLFMELEFDTLGKKYFGAKFSSAANRSANLRTQRVKEIQTSLFDEPVTEKTIVDVPHNYQIVESFEDQDALIEKLQAQPAFAFDTETTGLDPRTADPLGLAFSFASHEAYYVVCPDDPQAAKDVLKRFEVVLNDPKIKKIGHNLKYDLSLLKWQGISYCGPLFDTMLAHTVKEPEMRHGLDELARIYLGYQPIPTSDLLGPKGKEQRTMRDVPQEKVVEYACEDADVTWQVAQILEKELDGAELTRLCEDVEFPLVSVLIDMEFEGIRLDTDALAAYSDELSIEIEQLRSEIFAAAGHEFNIDSPKQMGVVLFDEMQLEANPKKTATGQYSTRESELERLSARHPIIANILEYRNAVKLKSVYVDQLPTHVDPRTKRIHTHYSQSWTATGRMQSNDPNLQTIPIRKARGRGIRAAFIARDDSHRLLSADYSQIELRVMAELSQDEAMLEAFREQIDIHTATAAKVYKVDLEDVTREMRDKAKTVNFGIIYGISAFGLQQRLNIPRDEAKQLIDNYFEKYPGVQRYIDETIAFAKEHGYVQTLTGRRRYLRDIDSRNRGLASAAERLAMNSPIQGTAADMLKLALIKVHQELQDRKLETKMLLSVHDEIVFDMPLEEEATVIPVIEEAMRNALPMSVPIVVEVGMGTNWLEAH
ncbi:DNA polymerase I [Roseimaritima multifibrata]|uniref:DNA polymerase I n=1 Tax=Roseimaritima multifibrata TaxID=1930274 RepID=A0A517MFD2_9BACT|nr:DNA polymerase I [Roseimaritima multifibrata]QDS93599.1 DNA polymerase I [Roseimaritima multifibrata]